jgi:DNA helicase-2/ATP-dependent DNA helicase PcrA
LVRRLGRGAEGAFAGYVEAEQKHNVLDYDDLLLYWGADDV